MKPAPFRYFAPQTLTEALALLAEHGGDAKLLAGGQSLIPVMNFRLAQPAVIIDLNRIPALQTPPSMGAGDLHIGAMVRQAALEASAPVARHVPLLAQALPYIAHPQIRHRGTLGGSLAHADPAAELPVVMVTLEARFRLQRAGGERWVSADAFYEGLFTTALGPDEMLTEVAIPVATAHTGFGFQEFARRHGDYALVGAAAVVDLDAAGLCHHARLVYLNAGERPMVAASAAPILVGTQPTKEVIAAAVAAAVANDIEPTGDIHASADYKRHLAAVLGRRALDQALQNARANGHQAD